jgi:hypothetical protein
MDKRVSLAILLGAALLLGAAATATAHEGIGEEAIVVEPANVTAGDTVVFAGSGLEPESDRVLVLAGQDLIVEFGTVRTDAEGMFTKELTIPSHLPSGTYELRAIGDETLTTPIAITAIAGGAEASPPADDATQTVVARERTPVELALILALVAFAAVAGGLLVWRAERFRGPSSA